MAAMILAGFIIVMAMLLTLARFDLRKFLGYASIVDIIFTVLMFSMFHGTFSGIVASAFAGIFMTLMLYMLRGTIGCKKLKVVCVRRIPRIRWVYYGPELYRGGLFAKSGVTS